MKSQTGQASNLLTAAALGVLQIGVAISLAALVFSGPLAPGAGRAAAGFVLGTCIVSLIVGSTTKMAVVIAGAQDTAAILVTAVAATIATSPDLAADQAIPTVVVMIAISALLTGVAFVFIGHNGLTSFVRFLPFPVISGFTVGTGWLLFRGGIDVMNRSEVSVREIFDLFAWPSAKFLLPGLLLAVAILAIISSERLPNTLVSVAILSGTFIFHIIGRSVSDLDRIESEGWLIGPFTERAGWAPIEPSDFTDANWSVLMSNGIGVAAIVAVSVIGLLLNLSGLEGDIDPQIDMNHEVRSTGAANVLVAATGGLIGYHLIGDTLLSRRIGGRGRIVPLTIAGMSAATFLLGPSLIGLIPRAVAGGVLAGLGLTLINDWAKNAVPQMNKTDTLLSSLILTTIAAFGVLTGVIAGVLSAIVVFIIKFGRTDPVRHTFKASGRSTIDRDDHDAKVLAVNSDAILGLELQGYLFFGSATGIRSQIEARVNSDTTDYVILDFSRVTGIDSTAVGALIAVANQLEIQDIVTVWSGADATVAQELQRSGGELPTHHVDLDHAIAWCENDILTAVDEWNAGTGRFSHARSGLPFDDDVLALLDLPKFSLVPGQVLIEAGATDNDVYFIEEGTLSAWVEATDGRQVRIRQVLPGSALGEVAFSTGEPRSARVIVDTPATVRLLRRSHFDHLVSTSPAAAIAIQHELLRRMGTRISSNADMIRDLLR